MPHFYSLNSNHQLLYCKLIIISFSTTTKIARYKCKFLSKIGILQPLCTTETVSLCLQEIRDFWFRSSNILRAFIVMHRCVVLERYSKKLFIYVSGGIESVFITPLFETVFRRGFLSNYNDFNKFVIPLTMSFSLLLKYGSAIGKLLEPSICNLLFTSSNQFFGHPSHRTDKE